MKRENNYDLLRCISAVMIIILHAGALYEQSSIPVYAQIGTFFQAVTRTAVPCFVMLSGAFLLNDERWQHYPYALARTKKVIFVPTVLYSILFIALSFFTYFLHISKASYLEVIILAARGYPYPHMWYMYMILGLYLSVPLLWKLKMEILVMGKNQYRVCVAVLLLTGGMVQRWSQLLWPVKFVPYIGYFMFGDLVYRYYGRAKKRVNWLAFTMWIVLIALSCYLQIALPEWKYWDGLATDPLNPVVILSSLGCFTFFSSLTVPWNTFGLARHTSRIYLVHVVVLQVVKVMMENRIGELSAPVIGIPFMVFCALFFSFVYSASVESVKKSVKKERV